MVVENLGNIRSYALLYVKYAYMYPYVIALVFIYGTTCNCFDFQGCRLSIECMVDHSPPFSLFPRYQSVGQYRAS